MKRREFLTLPAQSLGGVLLYTLAGEPIRLQAQTRRNQGAAAILHRGGSSRGAGGLRAHFPEATRAVRARPKPAW